MQITSIHELLCSANPIPSYQYHLTNTILPIPSYQARAAMQQLFCMHGSLSSSLQLSVCRTTCRNDLKRVQIPICWLTQEPDIVPIFNKFHVRRSNPLHAVKRLEVKSPPLTPPSPPHNLAPNIYSTAL